MGEKSFSKSITALALICVVMTQQTLGQITDNFSDGNLNANPVWTGSTTNFIVNASHQLQLTAAVAGNSYLALPFSVPSGHNTQWEFFVSHGFQSSAQNNSRIYLMSDTEALNGPLNGYYVQLGENGSLDAVQLFKQTGTTSASLLRGPDAQIFDVNFMVRIKVTRSSTGEWQLSIDPAGGMNFSPTATVTDNTFTTSNYFGVRCLYSAANISKFFFDDFSATTAQAPDVTSPQLSSISVVSPTQFDLNFSEPLNTSITLSASSFVLNDTLPASSAAFQGNNSVIRITFDANMKNGYAQKIQFPSVSDPSGNVLSAGFTNFLFFQPVPPQVNDIVINELYPDPSPSIGLPTFEFIEIHNRSENPFQVAGWTVTDGTTIGTLTDRILLPGEFLIVCPNDALPAFQSYGLTMGPQYFPSLNNSGDNIQLKAPDGTVIDSQLYNLSSYHNDDKDAGGYTLERIDPTDFCKGIANWKASENLIGGTPGQQNSIFAITPDEVGAKLIEIIPKESNKVTIRFDEKLSSVIPEPVQFSVSPEAEKVSVTFSNADLTEIDLSFANNLDSAITYTITATNVFDCPGNPLQSDFNFSTFKMDMIKPTVLSTVVVDQHKIMITFSERIDPLSFANGSIAIPGYPGNVAQAFSASHKQLVIDFESGLINGKDYTILIQNLSDVSGNIIDSIEYSFRFFEAQPAAAQDVVINELVADPSPVIQLPENEFVEIYNRSEKALDLTGWKITDGSSIGTLPNKIILPNEYLIICHTSFVSAFAGFGSVIGVTNFPSLNNSGDMIKLTDASGVMIDSIHYLSSWYQQDGKEDGGWSLERVNPNDFCKDIENWKASGHESGGTPGMQNSVFEVTTDSNAPDLSGVSVVSADSLVIHFSERIKPTAAQPQNFQSSSLVFESVRFTDQTLKSIGISLLTPLDSVTTYFVTLQNIFDCPGNHLPTDSATVSFKLDNILPKADVVKMTDSKTITISLSEKLVVESFHAENFSIDEIHPETVTPLNSLTLEIKFEKTFQNGRVYGLKISHLIDLSGNESLPSTHNVYYFEGSPVNKKDIIISEIFADPSPVIGLPETEFVELHNRSQHPIQLANWVFGDATHEVKLNDFILLPGKQLIMTLSSKAFQFEGFGSAQGLSSFPGLTNSGEPLILKDSSGNLIDSVFYSDQWYDDSEKKDGGWSLELIDPDNICSEGENWTASADLSGGTPGKTNSVLASKPDLTAPEVLSVVALSADTVVITFNEKLDALLPQKSSFVFLPPLEINNISFAGNSKRAYVIAMSSPLQNRVKYGLSVKEIYDCAGNQISDENENIFALPEEAEPGDIIVNEVLFNPRPTGVDFVEIFNRSEKYIDLKDWSTANLEDDTVRNKKIFLPMNFVLAPLDFLVLTSDPNTLKGEYLQGDESKMIKAALPTLSDNEGSLIVLDEYGVVIDTLSYSDDQHSPFLKNTEGVSLERIDTETHTTDSNNWHSASATSGYATPGLPNSNAQQNVFEESVSVHPEVFVPGISQPDFAMISYNLNHAGYVASVKIINHNGRVVKEVAQNELLGAAGFFKWHGDTTQGGKASLGAYMVWFEVFDEQGTVITIKKRVVVAERF